MLSIHWNWCSAVDYTASDQLAAAEFGRAVDRMERLGDACFRPRCSGIAAFPPRRIERLPHRYQRHLTRSPNGAAWDHYVSITGRHWVVSCKHYTHSDKIQTWITDIYCACKGRCDRMLDLSYRDKNCTTGRSDIINLIISYEYVC